MASIALPSRALLRLPSLTSPVLSVLPSLFLRPSTLSLAAILHSTATAPWTESTSLFPDGLGARLRELLPGWVLAVPKSKTTHSAKKMRSANKGLKERQSMYLCSAHLLRLSAVPHCDYALTVFAFPSALPLPLPRPRRHRRVPILRGGQGLAPPLPRLPHKLQEGAAPGSKAGCSVIRANGRAGSEDVGGGGVSVARRRRR